MENFEKLVKEHIDFIKKSSLFVATKYKIDSEELNSRVLEKCWKSRDTYTKTEYKFSTWLIKIINSIAVDMWRENNKRFKSTFKHISLNQPIFKSDNEISEYLPIVSNITQDSDNKDYLIFIIREFRKRYSRPKYLKNKIVFYMMYRGFKIKEISEHINIPENSIKSMIYNIRKELEDLKPTLWN